MKAAISCADVKEVIQVHNLVGRVHISVRTEISPVGGTPERAEVDPVTIRSSRPW